MKRQISLLIFAGISFAAPLQAGETVSSSFSRKSTNISVSSSDLEPFSLNERTQPEAERAVFYADDKARVDINEDGDPNVNMRF